MHKINPTAPTWGFSAGNGSLEQCVAEMFSAQNAAKLKIKKKTKPKSCQKTAKVFVLVFFWRGGFKKQREAWEKIFFQAAALSMHIPAHPGVPEPGRKRGRSTTAG